MRLRIPTGLIKASLMVALFCMAASLLKAQDQSAPAAPEQLPTNTAPAEQPPAPETPDTKPQEEQGLFANINMALQPV
ncbi:MAG: hypothetical protein RLZZ458_2022, partial [Planctomycetota bacterium]